MFVMFKKHKNNEDSYMQDNQKEDKSLIHAQNEFFGILKILAFVGIGYFLVGAYFVLFVN